MRDNHRVVSPPRRTVLRNFMRGERQYICSATITTAASGSFSSSSFSSSAAATAAAAADAAIPAAITTAAAAADHPRGSIEPHFHSIGQHKRYRNICILGRQLFFKQRLSAKAHAERFRLRKVAVIVPCSVAEAVSVSVAA